MNEKPSMSAQERAALAIWLLMQRPHTTAAIARRLEMTTEGTRVMLAKISRVVPLYWDKDKEIWQILC